MSGGWGSRVLAVVVWARKCWKWASTPQLTYFVIDPDLLAAPLPPPPLWPCPADTSGDNLVSRALFHPPTGLLALTTALRGRDGEAGHAHVPLLQLLDEGQEAAVVPRGLPMHTGLGFWTARDADGVVSKLRFPRYVHVIRHAPWQPWHLGQHPGRENACLCGCAGEAAACEVHALLASPTSGGIEHLPLPDAPWWPLAGVRPWCAALVNSFSRPRRGVLLL